MAKQATAVKRQRRERGSINPNDIIEGAFQLAEEIGIDNLSMPLLGKHLGVGVTSIYWYFRKKDDLLNAMTDRAITRYQLPAAMKTTGDDWRTQLHGHARQSRAHACNPSCAAMARMPFKTRVTVSATAPLLDSACTSASA